MKNTHKIHAYFLPKHLLVELAVFIINHCFIAAESQKPSKGGYSLFTDGETEVLGSILLCGIQCE